MIIDTSKSDAALYFVEDLMERVTMPFFVLGKTAKHIHDTPEADLSGPIEVGVKKAELIDSRLSTLKSYFDEHRMAATFTPERILFEYESVPVTIHIIRKQFSVLKDPQTVFFKVTTVCLPNPFDKYWKGQMFIR